MIQQFLDWLQAWLLLGVEIVLGILALIGLFLFVVVLIAWIILATTWPVILGLGVSWLVYQKWVKK